MGRRSRGAAADRDARAEGAQDAPAEAAGGGERLPWGLDKAEMQPSSLSALTDDKLARFVIGRQKKTKFEKEREEREARKRQADAEAAEIYATFVASFDNEDDKLGKLFVRAQDAKSASATAGSSYRLKPKEKPVASAFAVAASESTAASLPAKKVSEMDRMLAEIKQKAVARQHKKEQLAATQPPRKRRAIDDFLEEIKERGPAGAYVDDDGHSLSKGSFDSGDPETTNLYVGNLAPTVTEEVLEREFGRFGQIYSVKIMWPRSEEERARRRNCGFVSFYTRQEADSARVNLHDKELEGQPMIVGWGKAVKIDRSTRVPGIRLPPAAPVVAAVLPTLSLAAAASNKRIKVESPVDKAARDVVDRLAKYVAADGLQFENAVRFREASNESYRFLFETESPLAVYYRWRVYAYAMGDKDREWRQEPFQMTVGGPVWIPPPAPPRRRSRSRSSSSRSASGERRFPGRASDSHRRKRRRSPSRSSSRSRSRSRRRSRSNGRNESRSRSNHRSSSRDNRHGRRGRSYSSDSSDSSYGDRRHSRRSRSRSRSFDRRRSRSDSGSRSPRYSRSRSFDRGDKDHNGRSMHGKAEPVRVDALLTGQQIARARDIESGREPNRLSHDDYEEFQELLAELTLERESVKRVMGFALDKSEAAVDLVNTMREAFHGRKESNAVALVGLLFVTSDILHNSSAGVKNASLFRTTFQDCLPEIMDVLRVAHKNVLGRMSANAMKDKVLSVLTAWESWSLFPPGYLVGLNATFLRKVDEADFVASHQALLDQVSDRDEERLRKMCKQSGILSSGSAKELFARLQWLKEFTAPVSSNAAAPRPAAVNGSAHDRDSMATTSASRPSSRAPPKVDVDDDVDGEPMDGDNLDGEASESAEDLDGEPMDGGGGNDSRAEIPTIEAAGADDIDGEPLDGNSNDEDEDLDGEPLDREEEQMQGGDDPDRQPMVGEEELDGVPMDEEELDGVPMDDDELDGEPM